MINGIHPTAEVSIRVFQPADLPDLIALERSVYGSGAYSYYFFRQLYDLFPRLVWVAARRDAASESETIVGHVCGAIAQDDVTGWILNLAVQAHFRRQGIGTRLINACVENLQAAGIQVVRTTLHTNNAVGIKAYHRLGFERVAVEDDYYGDGDERLILEKRP